MKWLYLIINLGSLSIPLLYSFNKNMCFIKHFKHVLLSTLLTAILFISWDIWFTNLGIWGFNDLYYLGFTLFKMPIEEWLFFFCIPYACLFTHYALFHFKPQWKISIKRTKLLTLSLILLSGGIVLFNLGKLYTAVNFLVLICVLIIGLKYNTQQLQRFYISFLFILIPFLLVNGVLTGSFIDQEVVWYNNSENLGIRLFTIPIEDMGYAFSLLFTNILLLEYLKTSSLWLRKKILHKTY